MMNAKRSSKANLTRYAFLVPAVVVLLFVFSLSKAEIVKNTRVAYKNIAASVKSLTPVAEVQVAAPLKPIAKTKKAIKISLKDTVKKEVSGQVHYVIINGDKFDVPPLPKGDGIDTGKNFRRTISVVTRNRNNNDSTETYMINGKVVSKEEFKKLTPEDIATINVFGDKLNLRKVTGIRLNGNTLNPAGRITIRLDSNKNFNYNNNSNGRSNTNLVITKDIAARPNVTLSNVRYSYNLNDGQNINNFTERLIIIDGKEAGEKALRKLPAADIDNVKVIDSPEMMEKYGEKAKKGVLFINTKKAKK